MSDMQIEPTLKAADAEAQQVNRDFSGIEDYKDYDESTEKKGQWHRSRLCACPTSAATDCRFHAPTEPGWEKCPHIHPAGPAPKNARWLWTGDPSRVNFEDVTTDSLEAVADRMTQDLIRKVSQ